MLDPGDRLNAAREIANLVMPGENKEQQDALASDLAKTLIPGDALRRLIATLRRHLVVRNESSTPPRPIDASSDQGPSKTEMRNHALAKIKAVTEGTPRKIGPGQTYRVGNGPTIYLRTRGRDQRQGDHRVYWFGLRLACWDDPDAWFVLQCALDFTVVVQVEDWLDYRDRIGKAEQGTVRQPHVHQDEDRYELREAGGFQLDIRKWKNNWDGFEDAHR